MAAKATQVTIEVAEAISNAGLPCVVERRSGASTIRLDADVITNCFVYPGTTSVTAETRDWSSREVTVYVHLFRFLDEADELSQVDELYELVEGIEDVLDNRTLPSGWEFLSFASDSSSRELLDPDTQTARYTFEAQLQVSYYESR